MGRKDGCFHELRPHHSSLGEGRGSAWRGAPDLDIFVEYARRLGLRDRDGEPLIKWTTAEEAFAAFGEMTRGRLCDYSGLSHDRLRGSPGIQWPCNESHPDGTERLYTDHVFETFIEECEEYGHDFLTGAARERKEFADLNPAGRAILHGVEYVPPAEEPSNDLPLRLVTGRTVYHFHTRTKTGRVAELDEAAPDVWVELAPVDAATFGIGEGDVVRVESPRGAIVARARLSGMRPGVAFVPFHYGSWGGGGSIMATSVRRTNSRCLPGIRYRSNTCETGRRAGHQDRGLGRRSCAGAPRPQPQNPSSRSRREAGQADDEDRSRIRRRV